MSTTEQPAITATVERTCHGWRGQTSSGRAAHITDGNSHWFSDDFGRLSDAEENALDLAAMQAIGAQARVPDSLDW